MTDQAPITTTEQARRDQDHYNLHRDQFNRHARFTLRQVPVMVDSYGHMMEMKGEITSESTALLKGAREAMEKALDDLRAIEGGG